MATVWYRSDQTDDWRTNPRWQNREPSQAHQTSDHYNQKYDSMYWVTDGDKPSKDKVPEDKE